MSVTIELQPDLEADLLALAASRGMSLEEYVLATVAQTVRPHQTKSPQERAQAWVQSAKQFPVTPPLPDEAISRESIYPDRS